MQTGSIKRCGKWWVLNYRADVLHNGVKQRTGFNKKLAPFDRNHQAKPDGSASAKIKALAALELAPKSAGLRQTHSGDSVKSLLAKGEGGRGRALNSTTKTSYKTMHAIAKEKVKVCLDIDRPHGRT
jgi:hypothetical protein